MLPYFYKDVNSKCLHEVANAYTDTDLLSNSQKIPLSGYSMSELDWENTQSNLGNENFIPGRTMSKFVILSSDTSFSRFGDLHINLHRIILMWLLVWLLGHGTRLGWVLIWTKYIICLTFSCQRGGAPPKVFHFSWVGLLLICSI